MTGAIDFLRKAKAICKSKTYCGNGRCPLDNFCHGITLEDLVNEADLVSKVMAYQLQEDEFDGKAEYQEAMMQDFDICDACENNQIDDCAYIENGDRKSCPKVMAYEIKEGKND